MSSDATAGNAKAQSILGLETFYASCGGNADEKSGLDWLQKSARQKYPPAFFTLGKIYEFSHRAQDAVAMFEAAAGLGLRRAEHSMAGIRNHSDPAVRDEASAYAWMALADSRSENPYGRPFYQDQMRLIAEHLSPQEKQRADVLRVQLIETVGKVPAYYEASETGVTYRVGFKSNRETAKLELRCDSAVTAKSVCELELFSMVDGVKQETDPLRATALDPLGGCKTAPTSEWDECDFQAWQRIRNSLRFAREHRGNHPDAAVRRLLAPLFESSATVQNCLHLRDVQAVTLCELSSSPWGRPTWVYFAETYGPCDPSGPTCEFMILPLFKSDVAAGMHTSGKFEPLQPMTSPSNQDSVAAYVKLLEGLVRSSLKVPAGTSASARVTYQLQFNQEDGRLSSVNFIGGCSCQSFRTAVQSAVGSLGPLPLLPPEQRSILGGRNGVVYLETRAASTQ